MELRGRRISRWKQQRWEKKRTAVLDTPSSSEAYFGLRSWWLQYSPARLHAPSENATLITTMTKAMFGTTLVPLSPSGSAGPGVIAASSSMHSAGPRKATPCASFLTRVMVKPRSTSESATGPTSGVITTMAT